MDDIKRLDARGQTTQLTDTLNQIIRKQFYQIVNVSNQEGRHEERARIVAMITGIRNGANDRRGGSYCNKEYLQRDNYVVEICDRILSAIKEMSK